MIVRLYEHTSPLKLQLTNGKGGPTKPKLTTWAGLGTEVAAIQDAQANLLFPFHSIPLPGRWAEEPERLCVCA